MLERLMKLCRPSFTELLDLYLVYLSAGDRERTKLFSDEAWSPRDNSLGCIEVR